jgi:hypothetical protein
LLLALGGCVMNSGALRSGGPYVGRKLSAADAIEAKEFPASDPFLCLLNLRLLR